MSILVSRDSEGYLVNPEDWNEDIANELAKEEGVKLNDEHWFVLNYIRDYYNDRDTTPDVRHVTKYLVSEKEYDKKNAKKYLFSLFPYGYVKQACKISGMRKPRSWSTG